MGRNNTALRVSLSDLSASDWTRFWKNVDVRQADECWSWKASTDKKGYGFFWVSKVPHLRSHRASYVIAFGEIPHGMLVCHRCDNPSCCNPRHLFLGTHVDNADDMCSKDRQAKGDKNGSRIHPERLARGDRHGSKIHPENWKRGDEHYTRLKQELVPRGERNGAAKINQGNVLTIRNRYSDGGVTLKQLGDEFGISLQAVWYIIKGRNWRHV